MLRIRRRDKTGEMEWALMSKSKPSKVLKWFGKTKPSPGQVAKEEARVEYYKNLKGK